MNTTVFSVINGLLLRPLLVPHAEQIAILAMQQAVTPGFQRFSYPDYQDIPGGNQLFHIDHKQRP